VEAVCVTAPVPAKGFSLAKGFLHATVLMCSACVTGAHWGSGRRKGEDDEGLLAEYLLALADKPKKGHTQPSTFVSLCRYPFLPLEAGSGLSASLKPLNPHCIGNPDWALEDTTII